jgi:hypothetical protein
MITTNVTNLPAALGRRLSRGGIARSHTRWLRAGASVSRPLAPRSGTLGRWGGRGACLSRRAVSDACSRPVAVRETPARPNNFFGSARGRLCIAASGGPANG